MSIGKNRYGENESNVKLKLKKGVYRKSKKWTKEMEHEFRMLEKQHQLELL